MKWKYLFGVLFLFFLSQCSSQGQDYYSQIQKECLFTDQTQSIPIVPPKECHDKLLDLIHFQNDTDADTEVQQNYILAGLYFLYNYPTLVPKEKKVFSLATLEHFMPIDLQNMMADQPEMPLQQILFNYVMNTVHIFRITKSLNNSAGFWNPFDQSINLKPVSSGFLTPPDTAFPEALASATMLLHEAWHARSLNHDVYCPEVGQPANECDKTMNGPHGVEAAYARAVLQGNEIRPLRPQNIATLAQHIISELSYIYSLPADMESFKQWAAKQVLTTYSDEGATQDPDYLNIIRLEQLTPLYPADKFTPLQIVCPAFLQSPTVDCQKALDSSVGNDPPITSSLLFILMTKPLTSPDTLFQLGPPHDLFMDHENEYFDYVFATRSRSVNRFLVDSILTMIYFDSSWESILSDLDLPINPSKAELYLTIKRTLLPWSFARFLCETTECSIPSLERIERSNRFALLYLVSILHTNRLQPNGAAFLNPQEEEEIFSEICSITKRLGKLDLPTSLKDLPTFSCDELKNRF